MLTHKIYENKNSTHQIIILHGLGDSMEGWEPIMHELNINHITWVFVNAPIEYYTGYSWFQIPNMTSETATRQGMINDMDNSRQKLEEFLEHLQEKNGIPPEKTILMGFSQGCFMVTEVALQSDEKFSSIIGISGRFAEAEKYPQAGGKAIKEQKFLITHGYYDEVLPINETITAVKHLQDSGIDITFNKYEKGHGLDPVKEIPYIKDWIEKSIN